MKTLRLYKLEGYYYIASVNNGPRFELGYFDVDDWSDENKITKVINVCGD